MFHSIDITPLHHTAQYFATLYIIVHLAAVTARALFATEKWKYSKRSYA